MFNDEHGTVCFTFAGMGPLEGLIRKTLERDQLTNVSIVRVESATDVLKQMDVFVHPGLDDAMPVSIVEAIMCGVPCIGSDVGGVPDLIRDGIEGFLVDPASSRQLFEAMNRFEAMNKDELETMSRQARARYEEECAPAKVGASIAGHYREMMASAHDRR